jgi:hypothetical protein
VLILASSPLTVGARDGGGYSGLPLTEVLVELRAGGLRIVYSSAVVDDSMVVETEPTGNDARSILDQIVVRPGSTVSLRFDLVPVSVFLSEVIVTPSHFRLLGEQPESRQFLSREEVQQMPHAADDLYRAVKRLPGAAGGDLTAKINVRGGDQDELLVILAGVELYEPFHLKDFQSVFSIIDSEAVGGVDFLTGGFPVEYGDRMSGVMDISVATPSGPASTASITPYDPAWAWTQKIAPAFDIEGRSVLAFLDWVSVETGLTIRFSDREVERLAATTILHGNIEGLSPAQAPAVILPSCRLAVTEEPGTLLVRRMDAETAER